MRRFQLDHAESSLGHALVQVRSTSLAIESTLRPVRGDNTTLSIVTRLHWEQGLVDSSDSITTAILASAPSSTTDAELAQDGRETGFKQFEVADPGVGHVGVHGGLTVPRWTRRCTAAS
jgi:hypothetical protein